MIIAPAYAPTDADAKPETNKPIAKNTAIVGLTVSCTAV